MCHSTLLEFHDCIRYLFDCSLTGEQFFNAEICKILYTMQQASHTDCTAQSKITTANKDSHNKLSLQTNQKQSAHNLTKKWRPERALHKHIPPRLVWQGGLSRTGTDQMDKGKGENPEDQVSGARSHPESLLNLLWQLYTCYKGK